MRKSVSASCLQASALAVRSICRGVLVCLSFREWTNSKGESGMATRAMEHPKVVAAAEWLSARKELLKEEKEFSRLRDELSPQRRELPWEKVDKACVFSGPKRTETLPCLSSELIH